MESNEIMKMIADKPELARALEDALRKNADEGELAGILADAGIDADIANELLAECQRRRGAEIGSDNLDPEVLKSVAGGIGEYGGCATHFYVEQCSATVENGSWCWSNDKCVSISERYTRACNSVYKSY